MKTTRLMAILSIAMTMGLVAMDTAHASSGAAPSSPVAASVR
jgi:hypothetical protein